MIAAIHAGHMEVSYHKRTAKDPRREAGQAGRGVDAMTIQTNGYASQSMQAMQQARSAYANQANRAGQASQMNRADRANPANQVSGAQGTFKSQEIRGNDPNARAQAGQAFMNRNPSPDPKEGVVMQLSQNSRDLAEKLTQQSQAKSLVNNEDGRVTQVAVKDNGRVQSAQPEPKESTYEKIRERQQAKADEINPATQPKTATEAVKAQEDKRAEVKAEDKKEDAKAETNTTYEKSKERQQAKEDEMNPAAQPKTATEAVKAQEDKRTEEQGQAQQAAVANAIGTDALRVA